MWMLLCNATHGKKSKKTAINHFHTVILHSATAPADPWRYLQNFCTLSEHGSWQWLRDWMQWFLEQFWWLKGIWAKAAVEAHIKQSIRLRVRQSHLNTGHKLLEWMVSQQRSLEYHRTVWKDWKLGAFFVSKSHEVVKKPTRGYGGFSTLGYFCKEKWLFPYITCPTV